MMGISLSKLVLIWMTSLVPDAPWKDTYEETSQAIAEACEESLPCAATLTAIAFHESRFSPGAVGDRGQSVGLFQLSRVWGAPSDALGQARYARALVRRSRAICRGRPEDEQLGWFASGGPTCGRPGSSRIRMQLAKYLLRGTP